MFSGTYSDSILDGPAAQAAKGPLVGGGLNYLVQILVKKFVPSQAKHAALIGTVAGAGAAYALKDKLGTESAYAGMATSLIVGLPKILDDYMGTGLLSGPDDLGAYTMEGLGAYTMEGPAGMEMLSEAPAIPLQLQGFGAVVPETAMGEGPGGLSIQGSDFGATGF
jgi:hypothetical protein